MKNRAVLTWSLLLFILSFMGRTTCYAQVLSLKSYQAKYTVKYDGIPFGYSQTKLLIFPGHHYSLCISNFSTLPFLRGQVKECSEGKILQQDIIQPKRYYYDYEKGSEQQSLNIDFDWQKKQATVTTANSIWHMPLVPNTQDKISYQLALRIGLIQNKTAFTFPIADGGKLKVYRFSVIGKEKITTPFSNYDSVKLKRLPMPGKEKIFLWTAPPLAHMIIRVQQSKHIINIGTAEITQLEEIPTHAKV